MRTFKTVPNTMGRARYYSQKRSRKAWKYKLTLSKKLAGRTRFRHLYIRR